MTFFGFWGRGVLIRRVDHLREKMQFGAFE
jgi:hypothetical protein